MTESALDLRKRKLRELEEKLAREKRVKKLEDFKYKRTLEMQTRKFERPQSAKIRPSKGMNEQLERRNKRLHENQVRLQKEFEKRREE